MFYSIIDKFGRRLYHAAQVKASDIHNNSRKERNAASIASQLDVARNADFIDEEDNEKKKIDNVMLITSGSILDAARM